MNRQGNGRLRPYSLLAWTLHIRRHLFRPRARKFGIHFQRMVDWPTITAYGSAAASRSQGLLRYASRFGREKNALYRWPSHGTCRLWNSALGANGIGTTPTFMEQLGTTPGEWRKMRCRIR